MAALTSARGNARLAARLIRLPALRVNARVRRGGVGPDIRMEISRIGVPGPVFRDADIEIGKIRARNTRIGIPGSEVPGVGLSGLGVPGIGIAGSEYPASE